MDDTKAAIEFFKNQIKKNMNYISRKIVKEIVEAIFNDISQFAVRIKYRHVCELVENWLKKLKNMRYKENGDVIYQVALKQFIDDLTKDDVPLWLKKIYLAFIVNNRYRDRSLLGKILQNAFVHAANYETQHIFIDVLLENLDSFSISNGFQDIFEDNMEIKKSFDDIFFIEDKNYGIRSFINKFNLIKNPTSIISLKSSTARLENYILGENIWVNFNIHNETISFQCLYKNICKNVELCSNGDYEIVILHKSSIKKIMNTPQLDDSFLKLIFVLKNPCTVTTMCEDSFNFLKEFEDINFTFTNNIDQIIKMCSLEISTANNENNVNQMNKTNWNDGFRSPTSSEESVGFNTISPTRFVECNKTSSIDLGSISPINSDDSQGLNLSNLLEIEDDENIFEPDTQLVIDETYSQKSNTQSVIDETFSQKSNTQSVIVETFSQKSNDCKKIMKRRRSSTRKNSSSENKFNDENIFESDTRSVINETISSKSKSSKKIEKRRRSSTRKNSSSEHEFNNENIFESNTRSGINETFSPKSNSSKKIKKRRRSSTRKNCSSEDEFNDENIFESDTRSVINGTSSPKSRSSKKIKKRRRSSTRKNSSSENEFNDANVFESDTRSIINETCSPKSTKKIKKRRRSSTRKNSSSEDEFKNDSFFSSSQNSSKITYTNSRVIKKINLYQSPNPNNVTKCITPRSKPKKTPPVARNAEKSPVKTRGIKIILPVQILDSDDSESPLTQTESEQDDFKFDFTINETERKKFIESLPGSQKKTKKQVEILNHHTPIESLALTPKRSKKNIKKPDHNKKIEQKNSNGKSPSTSQTSSKNPRSVKKILNNVNSVDHLQSEPESRIFRIELETNPDSTIIRNKLSTPTIRNQDKMENRNCGQSEIHFENILGENSQQKLKSSQPECKIQNTAGKENKKLTQKKENIPEIHCTKNQNNYLKEKIKKDCEKYLSDKTASERARFFREMIIFFQEKEKEEMHL